MSIYARKKENRCTMQIDLTRESAANYKEILDEQGLDVRQSEKYLIVKLNEEDFFNNEEIFSQICQDAYKFNVS